MTAGNGGSDIDHLLCKQAVVSDVHVLEHGGLSDHRPVGATLTS
jgi:endonuclease/exonuclease/phosphatase family metal-dependent hydrolase